MRKQISPYGSWQSPIEAELLASAEISLGYLHV